MPSPIYTSGPLSTSYKLGSEFTAPLSQVLAAEAEEAWLYSPLSSIGRNIELDMMQGKERIKDEVQDLPATARRKALRDEGSRELIEGTGVGEILSTEEAKKKVKEEGVSLTIPKVGITSGALSVLIKRKKEEMAREDVFSRAEAGFATGAARLGVGLGVTFLDPINLASAFIPVVGQARYAQLLAQQTSRIGRLGVRARVGLAEGAVGAAVVEPIVLSAATAEQADYDLTDTMLNIVFGGIMGAGLRGVGGEIGDAIKARTGGRVQKALRDMPLEAKEAIFRGAVAEEQSGYRTNVETAAKLENKPAIKEGVFVIDEGQQQVTMRVEDVARQNEPELFEKLDSIEIAKNFEADPRAKEELELELAETKQEIEKVKVEAKKKGKAGQEAKRELKKLLERYAAIKGRADPARTPEHIHTEMLSRAEEAKAAAIKEIESKGGRQATEDDLQVVMRGEGDSPPPTKEEMAATYSPQNKRMADFEALDEINERVDSTDIDTVEYAQKEADEAIAEAKELEKKLGEQSMDMSAYDDVISNADESVWQTASSCMLRRV